MRRHNYQRILAWLTPANVENFYRTVADLRCRNVPRPGDRRRLAGIEELRTALHDRFGAQEEAHG